MTYSLSSFLRPASASRREGEEALEAVALLERRAVQHSRQLIAAGLIGVYGIR
jgi:hypothetical protein